MIRFDCDYLEGACPEILRKIEETNLSTCSHCHQPVRPHTVCSNCGYYDGKEVIEKKADKE